MKYAVWFVRLLFAAWMIPAGINHFIPIFPQPMGSQPLSQELIRALIDSNLFDLVKAVELIAGVGVLLGYYTPLALVICLPVSFNVFYWDAPLEGWGSRAALFGYATLLSNTLLCLAYFKSYHSMFALHVDAAQRQQLVLAGRIVLGTWMLLSGANYFFVSLWPALTGHEPLAIQLMSALVNSQLLDVAMAIQLVAGALILAGVLLPFALCLLMPISTCALFWAAVLDQQPMTALLALLVFALNGLLMLAYLPSYQGTLQRSALAVGETAAISNSYDSVYVNPNGRITQAAYLPALVTVLAAIAFFHYLVTGRTAQFCILMLLYPAFVLLANRVRDMGLASWLVLPPLLLMLVGFAIQLGYLSLGNSVDTMLPWIALAASAALALWGAIKQ